MLSALFGFREFLLSSRIPVIFHGEEPAWLRRNAEYARELKALRADEKRARRRNAADNAERGWLARRLGLARD